jgi:hypothetical protein
MNIRSMSCLALALSVGVGCTGLVNGLGNGGVSTNGGSPGSASSGGSGGNSSGVSTGGSSPVSQSSCTPGALAASPVHARLLSPSQYDNTVLDLLGVSGDPAGKYNVAGGETAALDKTALEFRANAAASIAEQAATSFAMWSPCVPATVADQPACESQIIDQIGRRAYRHPLSAGDTSQLKTLFDAGIAAKGFETGVNWFLTGVLQSPDFQYQLIRPAAAELAGQVVPITGYELANRLSYYIWDSMPDEALFAAAATGLNDAQSIQAQVTRMLADQTMLIHGMSAFYGDWLNIAGFSEGIIKSDPAFTQAVATSLGRSLLLGATNLYATASPNFASLFSGESFYLNDTLQNYYKVKGAGTAEFTATDMPGQHRSGLLTHPGFLAVNARPGVTAPINRGYFVLANLMCIPLVVPSNLVIPPLPDAPTPGLTTRQQIEQLHVSAACTACHSLIDPPGFALEGFDEVGNVRTTDNGRAVDTSGIIVNSGNGTALASTDLDGPFATGDDFLSRLPTSATAKACFAQQFLEHAVSGEVATSVAADDQCAAASVSAAFAKSGDLSALVALVASSNTFLYRKSEGPPQ